MEEHWLRERGYNHKWLLRRIPAYWERKALQERRCAAKKIQTLNGDSVKLRRRQQAEEDNLPRVSAMSTAAFEGNLEMVKWLYQQRCHEGSRENGDAPMRYAVEANHLHIVKYLHEVYGSSGIATLCPVTGDTLVHHAVLHGALDVARYVSEAFSQRRKMVLLHGLQFEDDDHVGEIGSDPTMLTFRFSKSPISGDLWLHRAAEGGHLETVQWVVENMQREHDEDAVSEKTASNAEHDASQWSGGPISELLQAARRDDSGGVASECAEKHDARQGLLEARNARHYTAMMCACKTGHLVIVQYLFSSGANIHATSKSGNSCLMWAALNGHQHVVEYLALEAAPGHATRTRQALEAKHRLEHQAQEIASRERHWASCSSSSSSVPSASSRVSKWSLVKSAVDGDGFGALAQASRSRSLATSSETGSARTEPTTDFERLQKEEAKRLKEAETAMEEERRKEAIEVVRIVCTRNKIGATPLLGAMSGGHSTTARFVHAHASKKKKLPVEKEQPVATHNASDLFVADKYGRVPMGFACINGDSTSVKWIEGVVKGEKETTLKFRDSDTDRLLGISDEKINKHTLDSQILCSAGNEGKGTMDIETSSESSSHRSYGIASRLG